MRKIGSILICFAFAVLSFGQTKRGSNATWYFAASGDSRNCGDVVVPAIAQGVARDHGSFYWHLGDLRAIYDFDEDMLQAAKMKGQHLTIATYEKSAWDNFTQNQVIPFGEIPFFLGIGNHETVQGLKSREQFLTQFTSLLDRQELRDQRINDAASGIPDAGPKTYFHWVRGGVDFFYLDNATADQFDAAQLSWFEAVLANDTKDDSIRTVVLGMHKALPYSISQGHSMNESPRGEESGRQVYQDLLRLQNASHKKVHVLASHSHYYMEDIFNTDYWHKNGGVLPGWIVGTAGAHRYALPEPNPAPVARTNVYGYLLGAVDPSGRIDFQFKEINEADIPESVLREFTPEFVHWCFAENTDVKTSNAGTK